MTGISTGMLMPFGRQADTLTYEPFFGLKEKAFSLDADPRYLFRSPSHAATFEGLVGGIRRREGLLVVTGEIGTGKTTLCRAVLRSLGRKTFSAFVADPCASREDLLKILLVDFGVIAIQDLTTGPLKQASRAELGYLLSEFLESVDPPDAFVVVVIDEAQNMSLPMIEETRILSDAFGGRGRLQIVFVGQLELLTKLKLPEMRQVDQRVCGYNRLSPLDREAVAGYVQHRLQMAGGRRDHLLFSPDVIEPLHQRTGGVPRLINRVCDRALDMAHQRQAACVDRDILETVLIDIGPATLTPTWASVMFPEPEVTARPGAASAAPAPAATPPTAEVDVPAGLVEVRPAAAPVAAPAVSDGAEPSRSTATPAVPAVPAVEGDEFSKRVDDWLAQELASNARTLTSLHAFAEVTPVGGPAPDAVRVSRKAVSREVRPRYSTSDPRGESASTSVLRWFGRRRWMRRVGIAVGCLAAVGAAVSAASHLSTALADPMMAQAEPPMVPAPPTLAVAGLAPPVAPPIDAPEAPETVGAPDHFVAVGLFADHARADRLVEALTQAGLPAGQRPFQLRTQRVQQVVLGPFVDRADAVAHLQRLRRLGGYDDANVVDPRPQPATP